MAGTVVQGNVSTEEFAADEKALDMDSKIRQLKPDDSQYTTMQSKLSSVTTTREKYNWLEEEDFPRIVSVEGAVTNVATTLVLEAGQGKIVRPNDILRNMRTNEAVKIISIATDTLTLATRPIGSAPNAAMNDADALLVVADAQPQGSDFPVARYLARVLGFNYTQIARTPWTFTGTATAIELYGGREPAKEAVRKAREHRRKIEAIAFFGARSFVAAAPPENEPQGTAGGLIEFIQTNVATAPGTLTPDFFDLWLMQVMAFGTADKVLFAAPSVVYNMSKWNRSGMGSQWEPSNDNVHGVHVDAFISGAYGYRVPVIVKKEWAEFPAAGYGGYAFLVDMSYVNRVPLRDRDTKLLTEQQPKGKDTYAAEYMTELTFQVAQEKAHGLLKGVTAT